MKISCLEEAVKEGFSVEEFVEEKQEKSKQAGPVEPKKRDSIRESFEKKNKKNRGKHDNRKKPMVRVKLEDIQHAVSLREARAHLRRELKHNGLESVGEVKERVEDDYLSTLQRAKDL